MNNQETIAKIRQKLILLIDNAADEGRCGAAFHREMHQTAAVMNRYTVAEAATAATHTEILELLDALDS